MNTKEERPMNHTGCDVDTEMQNKMRGRREVMRLSQQPVSAGQRAG
jgi:hypothetical protein